MEELLTLLKDGHARTTELLAMELNTSREDVERKIEYLEKMGVIRKVSFNVKGCSSCTGCPSKGNQIVCKGCLPEDGFNNMGQMWEVV